MIILTIRTDKPEAEIGLYDDQTQLAYEIWAAHRSLAETMHTKIKALLQTQGKDWSDLEAIVCYKGPGSFTGLRIGITVANSLAYSFNIPITGETTKQWIERGITHHLSGKAAKMVMPHYGADPHITKPRV